MPNKGIPLGSSVPVISFSQKIDRVFYNCGHGHYGLTHAVSSERLLCELLVGDKSTPE